MIAYQLISDITVTSATTSVSFTGLNITKDDDYLLVSNVNHNGNGRIFLLPNGLPYSSFYTQLLVANDSSYGSIRVDYSYFSYGVSTEKNTIISQIKLTNNGYIVMQHNSEEKTGTSSNSLRNSYSSSTSTSQAITSVLVAGETSNAIGIGSRFKLYKLTAQKVADIIVSSPTTSVDITGLAIDKGSEYMLVADIVSSGGYMSIYPNNNTTNTLYYSQMIRGSSTTVSGWRTNYPTINASPQNHVAIMNIKLTNNGYFVIQSHSNDATPSNLELVDMYITSTFTLSSITTLSIQTNSVNAIGTNSRFQLYKLK